MIKWYLVLYIVGGYSSMTTIPQTYDDKQVCEEAAKDWDSWGSGRNHMCIKVPVNINLGVGSDIITGKGLQEGKIQIDKGYVCHPGDNVCQTVK